MIDCYSNTQLDIYNGLGQQVSRQYWIIGYFIRNRNRSTVAGFIVRFAVFAAIVAIILWFFGFLLNINSTYA